MDHPKQNGTRFRALGSLAFVVLVSAVSMMALRPPGGNDEKGFSTSGALKHLRIIARQPHPVGSEANRRVRAYIVGQLNQLGFEVAVQSSTVTSRRDYRSYEVHNILARYRGTGTGKAVCLAAHYDSAPAGPGAADDGAAVAALMEAGRVLRREGPFPNDLILLLTDGEEAGLLGAFAFVQEHEWFHDIGLVLNFEARGTSGPSIMFETSRGNHGLVQTYARFAPHPVTSSLSVDIYRYMPNWTDFTVFQRAGLKGLNFAFIGSPEHYHTAQDDVGHLDVRSLRHHGNQALALARQFLGMDLTEGRRDADAVFFSVLGVGVIHYSVRWARPFCLLPVALFVALIAWGRKRNRLKMGRVALAAAGHLLAVVLVSGSAYGLWLLLKRFGTAWDTNRLIAACLLLNGVVALAWSSLLGRWLGDDHGAAGACVWGVLLAVAASIGAPEASYLFTWPVLCSSGALLIGIASADTPYASVVACVSTVLLAVPPVVLILPMAYLAYLAMGVRFGFALSPVVVLLVWNLLPQLRPVGRPVAWPVTKVPDCGSDDQLRGGLAAPAEDPGFHR